ncbi:MAG: transposase [Actinobacteria bacterium]|nr:transposase [Actinomycetota bacterium]
MLHAGVDMHKRYSVVTVVDDEGKALVKGAKLPNDEERLIAFFKRLEEEKNERVRVVLEAGPSWMQACDLLDDYAIENVLCHPLKTKAIAQARIKTDKLEQEILAQLLRTDFIPCAHKPTHAARSLRELLRYRASLVEQRTGV